MRRLLGSSAVLVLAFALFSSSQAFAVCVPSPTNYFDQSGACDTNGREMCPVGRITRQRTWNYGGHRYLVVSTYTSLNFYTIDNPLNPQPALIGGAYSPWGYYEGPPDDDEQQWDAALLDDYGYGIAMFQNFGFATFRVHQTGDITRGLDTVYRFRQPFLPSSSPAHFARLFRASDGHVYAVGSYLDQRSETPAIVTFDDPAVLNVVSHLDPLLGMDPIETLEANGKTYLFAMHRQGSIITLYIYDISTPSAPVMVASPVAGTLSSFSLDKVNRRLFVVSNANPAAAYVFNVSDPGSPALLTTLSPPLLAQQNWSLIAGYGDLLVVGQLSVGMVPSMQAFTLANMSSPMEIAAGELNLSLHANEYLLNLLIEPAGNDYALYRAAYSIGSVSQVLASCMSLDPHAAFTVTGGDPTASCGTPATGLSAGVADEGFPGDTFTINDGSYGQITGKTLTITPASGGAAVFSSTWTAAASWQPALTWTPGANPALGEYLVAMTLTPTVPTSTRTMSIGLCGNPKASLAISQENGVPCTSCPTQLLINDNLNVSGAGSAGHPTGGYSFYVLQGGSYSPLTGSGSTLASPYTLTEKKSYTIGVVAHYGFAAADDATCPVDLPPTYKTAGVYNSCASVTVNAGYGVSSFEVWQNNQKVADSATPGIVLIDQATTLKFTGRIANPYTYTPNLNWSIPGLGTAPQCSYAGWPTTAPTCTIFANLLPVSAQTSWGLSVDVCNGGGLGSLCTATVDTLQAPPVSVTAVLAGFTFHVTNTAPAVGQQVGIVLDNITGPFNTLRVIYGDRACDTSTYRDITCGDVFGIPGTNLCVAGKTLATFSYASPGPATIRATGDTPQGPVNSSSEVAVNVSAGSCPAQTLTITPTPVSAAVGATVTFTTSPQVSNLGDALTFDFGDGQQGTLSGPCSLVCAATHTYATAGTKFVTATGTIGGVSYHGATSVTISPGGGGGNLSLSANKNPANQGDLVTIMFSPAVVQLGDSVTVSFGDGQSQVVTYDSLCQMTGGCSKANHTYTSSGSFTVTGAGVAGGVSVSGSMPVQLVVQNNCQYPSAPAANFTFSPSPARVGQPVQFTDTSTGNPTGWSWNFGDGSLPFIPDGASSAQNPVYTFSREGTFTVNLTASNCRGSAQKSYPVVVGPACTATEAPVADFTWGPTGPLTGFPEQMQPYAGQQVTLTDHSTNEPSTWHWYDFQEDLVDSTVTTPTFTHTWRQPGDKNVRMTAANCSGQWSAEVLKTVHIYEDVRHVSADFSWSPLDVATGMPVTFTAAQGPSYGDPDDFTWTFDDGSTQSGASVTYAFKCGGNRRVTLIVKRNNYNNPQGSATVSKSVTVSGATCGPESVMGVDAAKIQGLNDTNWHADLRIYNPSSFATSITLQFLPVGKNNVDPFTVGPYKPPLPPKATLVLNDILQWVLDTWKQDFSKTALRVTYRNEDNVAPVMTVRTYNLRPDGSKYGQINPGVNVVPGSTVSPQWITGLHNDGLTDGFRTNYSIVNLQGDEAGVGDIKFTIFDETGTPQGTKTFGLAPFGYIQDSIKNLFGPAFENIGTFSLKVEVPAGKDVQVYASVMDNHTGDPVLIPATTPPDSPVYLPAIAHNSGEANTIWRTDFQLTNPDPDSAHTWEIKYTPTGNDPIVVARPITVAPDKSVFMDDLVAWVHGGMLPADAETKGIVRIAPTDGLNVYPIVAARSFNLTPVGTFGQGIPPLWAARGISTISSSRRLVLTGMSSEDIARTNLGFVNVSETQGVNFVVYFYDDRGNVLNPLGTDGQPKPYTFAIGPGSWDQDKLENRFRNAFKVALPANLPAISAEITVNDGGPGFVYASVIDTFTGDPNFIPAQAAP